LSWLRLIAHPWTRVCCWAHISRGLPLSNRVTLPRLSSGKAWESDFSGVSTSAHRYLPGDSFPLPFLSAGIFAFTLAQDEFLYTFLFLSRSNVHTVPIAVVGELIRGDASNGAS
jgi:hypothetical protein